LHTAKTGLTADKTLGRIGVAIAPSNPNRIYVVFGDQTGPDKGFSFSDDGGDTLHVGGRAYQANRGYQWWFGRIWVDPDDQKHLFNADVSLRTSTDGGATWTAISAPHADQHGMDWDPSTLDANPATPDRVFLGNDGGMYRSEAGGVNGSWVKADLPAGPDADDVGAAGQRQGAHVDADEPVAHRPGAAYLGRVRRRRRALESDRPDRQDLLLRVLAGVRRRSSQLHRAPRHGDRDDELHRHEQRLPDRPALHDRRADRDRSQTSRLKPPTARSRRTPSTSSARSSGARSTVARRSR
jgi:hypothetical protein